MFQIANKLDDLRNKILTKFGFKRLWIEKHGKYTELWGEFNPKVLLMRDDNSIVLNAEGKPISRPLTSTDYELFGKGNKIGNKTPDGIVVSDEFARRLDNPNKSPSAISELEDALKGGNTLSELREIVESKRKVFNRELYLQSYPNSAKTANAIQKRGTLNSNLKNKPQGTDWEAHHLIPVEVLEDTTEAGNIMRQAIDDGFDFNCVSSDTNGIWGQRYSSQTRFNNKGEVIASPSGIHATHPKYTEEVKARLVEYVKGGETPRKAAEQVAKDMRNEIIKNPTIIINELFTFKL